TAQVTMTSVFKLSSPPRLPGCQVVGRSFKAYGVRITNATDREVPALTGWRGWREADLPPRGGSGLAARDAVARSSAASEAGGYARAGGHDRTVRDRPQRPLPWSGAVRSRPSARG